ncbi:hypothetical protein SISSUDRAFT_1036127 [Sistotremastrum suecicum HHB10207 ss-3]|uniref:Uncharacterized protein n=1 Tax=Sistotremastrum suecicum HHB10207 ss-3 TaxID=1314776 RepID=A0A165ZU80_9AGAM|nr:hypothetical protein SISSUDRAFT_1036127 [Sistotremastrum suecicum HHB10207 ss-3]
MATFIAVPALPVEPIPEDADVFAMLRLARNEAVNLSNLTFGLHEYFWAFWGPFFAFSGETLIFLATQSTCFSGRAAQAFLNRRPMPPPTPIYGADEVSEHLDVTPHLDVFVSKSAGVAWRDRLREGSEGWEYMDEEDLFDRGSLTTLVPHLQYLVHGTGFRISRFRKVGDDEDAAFFLNVIEAFTFASRLPISALPHVTGQWDGILSERLRMSAELCSCTHYETPRDPAVPKGFGQTQVVTNDEMSGFAGVQLVAWVTCVGELGVILACVNFGLVGPGK